VLKRWPIKYKLLFCVGLLFVIVGTLAISGFRGVYAYRGLARSVSNRATELPTATLLARHVSDLRVTLSKISSTREFSTGTGELLVNLPLLREEFQANYSQVEKTLRVYRDQLARNVRNEFRLGTASREQETVSKITRSMRRIKNLNQAEDWVLDDIKVAMLTDEVDTLHHLASELPSYLQQRMETFADDVRMQYRTWIVLTWITSLGALVLLTALVYLFTNWVFRPLRVLIRGSRQIARNADFDHCIRLDTHDEMSELATALNDMTRRFRDIRNDLDNKVQERTKQVVRSEQLASVGFLAAGVAHEINNPLASISFCAEAMEPRLAELAEVLRDHLDDQQREDAEVINSYLRMVQEQAFRCKEITERLLDFSRMGDLEKHDTDLAALVQGVIDMMGHVGRYREKRIELVTEGNVTAAVNEQQMKQVMLNLIANALDSLAPGGLVTVTLRERGPHAVIEVADDGCGMSPEVLEHLFEPFFTRRRDGTGTGLGLSITFRIVADHGGHIEAKSAGPGQGSQFLITLPRRADDHETKEQRQAA